MSIFFLVIALLVLAIVLSRFTSWSKWGERRSIEHHERAMEVLRSLSSRPVDPDETAVVGPGPVEDLTAVEAGDAGAARPTGTGTTKPAFVFFADDGGGVPVESTTSLPAPPTIDEVTGAAPSRPRALVLALSRTMDRPRLGIAVGLVTVVVMATVLGTLVGIMSSTSNRSQRVRQVTSPPPTSAPAPAPPPTTLTTITNDGPPSTALIPAQTSATTPTTPIPRRIRAATIVTSPPPTTSPPTTSPPTTSTPSSVVSSTPPTSAPHSDDLDHVPHDNDVPVDDDHHEALRSMATGTDGNHEQRPVLFVPRPRPHLARRAAGRSDAALRQGLHRSR